MKKNTRHQHHVGTSQSNLRAKPYGFCCDIKEHPKLDVKNDLGSLFSRHNLTGGGPNIKFLCEEINTVSTSLQRLNQKSLHRLGSRGRQRGRQKGGSEDMVSRQRGRNQGDSNQGNLREQIICERCRGPLKWYIEDEIDAARDIMMEDRQTNHNIQMEYNIKIAKKKGINREDMRLLTPGSGPVLPLLSVQADTEHTQFYMEHL